MKKMTKVCQEIKTYKTAIRQGRVRDRRPTSQAEPQRQVMPSRDPTRPPTSLVSVAEAEVPGRTPSASLSPPYSHRSHVHAHIHSPHRSRSAYFHPRPILAPRLSHPDSETETETEIEEGERRRSKFSVLEVSRTTRPRERIRIRCMTSDSYVPVSIPIPTVLRLQSTPHQTERSNVTVSSPDRRHHRRHQGQGRVTTTAPPSNSYSSRVSSSHPSRPTPHPLPIPS